MMKTAPLLSAQCHHPFWAASDVTGYFSSFVRVQNLYGSYRCSLIETKKAKSNSLLIRKQYRLNAVQRACSAWRNPTNEHYDPPKYPLGVKLLYCVYFCACLMERTWRFALPLVLANLEDGFRAVAVLGFISPLACCMLAPTVGRTLDSLQRANGLASLLGLQCFAIIASGIVLVMAGQYEHLVVTKSPVFTILLGLSMVEKLAAITSEVAIERDWVTQLCGQENNSALTNSNSMLRRMDLICEFLGTVAFGWLYCSIGGTSSLIITTIMTVMVCPLLVSLVFSIAKVAPKAIDRSLISSSGKFKASRNLHITSRVLVKLKNRALHAWDGWKSYFRQPILPSSLVFVVLFMNVALSPGGLTTAFLTSKGLDGSALAIFRGSCAVMGFLGTWYGKHLIEKHGLVKAGNHALFMLLASLGISFVMYSLFLSHGAMGHSLMFSIGGVSAPVVIFSLGIVFSRIGLWSFDMVNAQLFQQNVDETEAAATSSTEMALCMFVELFMLGLAAYVLLEDSFHVLVNASIGAVMLGSFVFNMWSRSNRVSLVHCESN